MEITDGWVDHTIRRAGFKSQYMSGIYQGEKYEYTINLDRNVQNISGSWHLIGYKHMYNGFYVANIN